MSLVVAVGFSQSHERKSDFFNWEHHNRKSGFLREELIRRNGQMIDPKGAGWEAKWDKMITSIQEIELNYLLCLYTKYRDLHVLGPLTST